MKSDGLYTAEGMGEKGKACHSHVCHVWAGQSAFISTSEFNTTPVFWIKLPSLKELLFTHISGWGQSFLWLQFTSRGEAALWLCEAQLHTCCMI